jgi:hypothetical protein
MNMRPMWPPVLRVVVLITLTAVSLSAQQTSPNAEDVALTTAISQAQALIEPWLPKPCPDQWKAFENAIRLERQVAVDAGASYYIEPERNEELVRIVLGNPYVDPLRLDHAAPVIDDEMSVWITHESKPATPARQAWVLTYGDAANAPGRQFIVASRDLGKEYGLFLFDVRYRNFGGDATVYATIGGTAMCAGNMWCAPEIRSWSGTNRSLRSARAWRSVLKVPQCHQLGLNPVTNKQEWYFELPSATKPAGVKSYVKQKD